MSEGVDQRREAFRAWVATHSGVQHVARIAGVPATTLYSYLSGKTASLKGTTAYAIAEAFNTATDALFRAATDRLTPLVGYVGAGAVANFYADGDAPLDYVETPEWGSSLTRAAEIRGDSLGPLFDGWVIYYDDVRSPVTEDLHGRLCVVGLADGQVFVKRIRPARDGRFHLIANVGDPLLDQDVAWAALVKEMRPR